MACGVEPVAGRQREDSLFAGCARLLRLRRASPRHVPRGAPSWAAGGRLGAIDIQRCNDPRPRRLADGFSGKDPANWPGRPEAPSHALLDVLQVEVLVGVGVTHRRLMLVNVLDFVLGEQRDDGIGGWKSKWLAVAHVCSRRARAPQCLQSSRSLRRPLACKSWACQAKECDARAAQDRRTVWSAIIVPIAPSSRGSAAAPGTEAAGARLASQWILRIAKRQPARGETCAQAAGKARRAPIDATPTPGSRAALRDRHRDCRGRR
jgi:hypothetical protein